MQKIYLGADINVADELVAEGYAVYTPEAQQARTHQLSFDSPNSSQTSSIYENYSNGSAMTSLTSPFNTRTSKQFFSSNDNTTTTPTTTPLPSLTSINNNTNNTYNIVNTTNSSVAPLLLNDNERFSAIFENTANENYENIQKDSSNFLINSEAEHSSLMNGNSHHHNHSNSSNNSSNNRVLPNLNNSQKMFPKDWNEMLDEDHEHGRV